MTSNIFLDTVNLVARAATSGTALPNVRGKLFAELVINVRFFDGTGTIIPVDVASVILEIKLASDPDGPALLQSSSPVVTGSGPTTLYAFAFDYADGDALQAALSGATAPVDMICTIQYALSGSMEQIDAAMSFENSYVRPQDQASDPVDAERWQWLKAHAPDAGGFAHDDTTRKLSVPGVANNAAAIAEETAEREAAIAGIPSVAAQIVATVEKTTPVDADKIPLTDSAAGNALKWLSWANLKARLKAYFDGIYSTFSGAYSSLSGIPSTFAPSAHTHDASAIVSGTLDPARIPVLYDGIHITSSGDLTALTSGQQTAITNGAIVTTTDGKRWCYTGSGSKTLQASYILLADLATNWSTISGKPSTFPPSALPTPTTSVLGGVLNNTGGSGQFVSGVGSDGSLLFGTPAGGGGAIIRASATLQGSTSADIPATAPGALNIYVNSATAVTFGVSATDYGSPILSANFTINYTDPSDGSYFIDLNVYGDTYSIAGAIYSILNGLVGGPLSVSVSGQTITLQTISTGSSTSLSGGAVDTSIISIWGGGSGTDDIPASGQISYAKIFGYVAGKVIRPLAVWGVSADLGEVVNVIDDYDGQNIVPSLGETGGVLNAMPPDISTIAKFIGACKGNIYAYVGSTASGGGATIYMIAELIDVPAYGTFQYYTCLGLSYVAVYADGAGGFYNVTIESNSSSCGYGS